MEYLLVIELVVKLACILVASQHLIVCELSKLISRLVRAIRVSTVWVLEAVFLNVVSDHAFTLLAEVRPSWVGIVVLEVGALVNQLLKVPLAVVEVAVVGCSTLIDQTFFSSPFIPRSFLI